jgi:WD40 repeat protein
MNMASRPDMMQLFAPAAAAGDADADACCSSLTASGTILAAASIGGAVALFDTRDDSRPRPFASWTAHNDALNCCRFLRAGGGTYLATASDDSSVRVWDARFTASGAAPVALYPAPAEVNCVVESTDGGRLYAGCDDGSVAVYAVAALGASVPTFAQQPPQQLPGAESGAPNQPLPPVAVERFFAGEGAVNDLTLSRTPYGDVLFTVADDGCARAWRTYPGQRAPEEPVGPTAEQLRSHMGEAAGNGNGVEAGDGGVADGDGDEDEADGDAGDTVPSVRAMIQDALGDEAANRLLSSFDVLRGGQTNHIVHATIGDSPHVLVACANLVFAVPFAVQAGALADEPSALFQGHEDFVRGLHPVARYGESGPAFFTVGDDGAVGVFLLRPDLESPIRPRAMFPAEQTNIMSSALVDGPSGAPLLATGALNGSVRLWRI